MAETYNPDVLTCLANLSNDEVFTPPTVVNQMLDLLPQELFESPKTRFLDPAAKSGVFLREITKRLIKGLEKKIPDLHERVNHILHEQVFGIATTELTSLVSRRSLYCSKYPNCKYSISKFDTVEGNIRFRALRHTFVNGRCKWCGASESQFDRDESLESHAYEFIHTANPKEIFNMKFDVIIGNPPYQMADGGNSASAMPIYQKFVEQAKNMNPRYLVMIIPARWYAGGRGLDAFRSTMLHDKHIRYLHDFPQADDCFPGVEIKGGVCYFRWDKDSEGECNVYTHINGVIDISHRYLLEDGMDTFIRSTVEISIVNKVKRFGEDVLSSKIKAGRYFGFHTQVCWNGNLGTLQTADGRASYSISKTLDSIYDTKVYIAHGNCWIKRSDVPRNATSVDLYKVLIPRSGNPGSTVLGKIKLSEPGSCSSNTYNVMLAENYAYAQNISSYLRTKFVRYLISVKATTQDTAPKTFGLVPIQDFSKSWTDEELYKKYKLTKDEIAFIESMIKPME